MQSEDAAKGYALLQWISNYWMVFVVLALALATAWAGYDLERRQIEERNQARFDKTSQIFEDDLRATLQAYGQFARSGAALHYASNEVTLEEWRIFVQNLGLEDSYASIQAVAFAPVVHSEAEKSALERRLRQGPWPEFSIRPDGERPAYAPVVYIQPFRSSSARVIGFDLLSEANRREAIESAAAEGKPKLSAKITLITEDAGREEVQAGAILVQPIFSDADRPQGAHRFDETTGLIISAIRMGNLVSGILEQSRSDTVENLTVSLFDAPTPDPEAALYLPQSETSGRYSVEKQISFFGRIWTYRAESTPAFEAEVAEYGARTILAAGILVSLLVASIVWGLTERNIANKATAETLAISNSRVELLMRETNHRSKNLLGLVQAIARQTSATDPAEFSTSFSKRLGALATSQDLLVKSQWTEIDVDDLLTTQLSHFEELIGDRITLKGAKIGLMDTAAQTLGMVVHELATNAGKYGALSNDVGRVNISWNLSDKTPEGQEFSMSWQELGGPPVNEPARKGFGTTVSVTMAQHELSGTIRTEFKPDGFEWHLTCPADRVIYKEETLEDQGSGRVVI